MKTIKSLLLPTITAIGMMLFATQSSAQGLSITSHTEKSDSLEFAEQTADSHPGGWNFDIVGLNITTNKHYKYNYKLPTITLFSGWGFGASNAIGGPGNMDINMGRSFHFCIEDIFAIRMHPWKTGTLSLGAGLDIRNYRMTGNKRFVEDADTKQISIEDYPEGAVPDYSKIHTNAATFNLKYIQYLGRGFRMGFGPELYVLGNGGGKHKIVTRYDDSTGGHKEKIKNIKANKVGLNLVGALTYKNLVGIYAKYSPSNVLNTAFGPECQSLSVGMMFFGF